MSSERDSGEINLILNQTNWDLYNRVVLWRIQVPGCPFYDGNYFCDYWRQWIRDGKALFTLGKKRSQEFLKDIAEEAVRPGNESYPQTINELKRRCRLAGIILANPD